LKFLKIMLEEAKQQGLIKTNPCEKVKFLPEKEKEIDILKPEEVRALFPANWREVWDNETHCVLNKLAACTGMRLGELLGLRGEYLFDGYISVAGQHGRYGYGDTKTHKTRNIPIPKIIEYDLLRLKDKNGDGYLFSNDSGEKPLGRHPVYNAFFAALEKIGIGDEERRKRGLSMHGWRHFFNTTLLMANVSDSKVMSVTGHVTKKMKRWHRTRERPAWKARITRETRNPPRYTHFDTTKFSEVVDAQERLLTDKGAGKAKAKKK
jgi:integrase